MEGPQIISNVRSRERNVILYPCRKGKEELERYLGQQWKDLETWSVKWISSVDDWTIPDSSAFDKEDGSYYSKSGGLLNLNFTQKMVNEKYKMRSMSVRDGTLYIEISGVIIGPALQSVRGKVECSTITNLYDSINQMVDYVVTGGFDINPVQGDFKVKSVDKQNNDENRPLKSVATDLVVNEFFKEDTSLYQFLSVTSKSFEKIISQYSKVMGLKPMDIFFVYKGGNILRIVSNEFLLELPNSAIRELDDYYKPFFKRGDADFGIYINPYLDNYEQIFHQVTLLAYLLQDQLRSLFSYNLTKYFDFFKFNPAYQKQILRPYLEKFNEAEGFENQFVDFKIGDAQAIGGLSFSYRSNPDVAIGFINKEENWELPVRMSALLPIKDSNSIMTITHNDALDFPGGNAGVREKFNLTRTKFIFTLLQRDGRVKNVGGELIDVGTQHRASSSTESFFKMVNSYITTYKLSLKGICELDFKAYSIKYLIYDLENILFSQREYPWVDAKYKKRLNRLIYMHFVNIFIVLEDGNAKMAILNDFLNMVVKPLIDQPRNSNERIEAFVQKYNNPNLEIRSLCKNLIVLVGKLTDYNFSNMVTMMEVVKENLEIILSALNKVRNYCSVEGKVTVANVENGGFELLI